jgi:HlyD family secretion protein
MKLKFSRGRLVALGIGALVVALLVWAFLPKPVPVDLASVERGALAVTVDEEGETRVHDRYAMSAPVAGRVLRIELEPGDAVAAGDALARFLPSDPILLDARSSAQAGARVRTAEANLGQARAQRQRVEAQAELAASERARIESLAGEGIVSREQLQSATTAAATAAEAIRAARFAENAAAHELELARAGLFRGGAEGGGTGGGGGAAAAPVVLRSPIDGVVLRRLRESESVVPAGDPLVEVGDPGDLEIVSDLLSSDAVKVTAGDPVWIEQWGGGEALHGRVRRVEPSGFTKISALGVEEQRVNVIVDFADPRAAWKALGDGYRVEVRIVIWQGDDVVKVATSSLFRHGAGKTADSAPAAGDAGAGVAGRDAKAGTGWAVFKAEGGRARLTPVEVGRRNGLEAQILSGLGPGDQVILHPSDQVADGVKVEARGE